MQRLSHQLETEVLPRYLRQQRWFAAKNRHVETAVLQERCEWTTRRGKWLMTAVQARFADGGEQSYFLPLAIDWGVERAGPEHAAALARVRQKAATGLSKASTPSAVAMMTVPRA